MAATPNVQLIIDDLSIAYPTLTFQTYNRRHIGSNPMKPWSQHAGNEPANGYYGNAVDIFDPADDYDSKLLDSVHGFLQRHEARYLIRVILWRVAAHHNHIHVDTWPKMKDNWWYRPPPAGKLVTIAEDGTKADTFGNTEEEEMTVKQGDSGNTVIKIQQGLNGNLEVFAPTAPKLVVDGRFGSDTYLAVRSFQSGADLPVTGEVGGIEMALLMEYVPDKIDNHTDPGAKGITQAEADVRYALKPHRHEVVGETT